MPPHSIRNVSIFSLLAAAGLVSPVVHAATLYWDGDQSIVDSASSNTSTTGMNWLSGGNWDDGTTSAAKSSWTAGDVAIFGGNFSGTQTVTVSSSIKVGDGTVIGSATSSYLISVNTGSYNSLGGGGAAGNLTINAGSTLSADNTTNNAHNLFTLVLNGGILTSNATDSGFGNWVLRNVTVGGTTLSTISSKSVGIATNGTYTFTVADSVTGSGTDLLVSAKVLYGNLNKAGDGTMELTNANTYGATNVNAGTLLVSGASGALGTGNISVATGATLEFGAATTTKTIAVNISGGGTITKASGARYSFSGNNSGFTGTYNQTAHETALTSTNSGSASATWNFGGTWFVTNIGTGTIQLGALSGGANHWNDSASGTSTLEIGGKGIDSTYTGNIGNGTYGAATALTKVGTGKLTLSGANSYTGVTTIKAGTLALTGSGSVGSTAIIVGDAGSSGAVFDVSGKTGGYTLATGKTISGIGTILGNITVDGTHNPGNSPGVQTVQGNLNYGSSAIFNWELGDDTVTQGTSPNYTYDQVAVTGSLTITTGATFNLVFNGAGSGVDFSDTFWTSDRSWNVFTGATSVTGNFTLGSISNDSVGNPYTASNPYGYFTVNGATLTWTAVPEPTSALAGLVLGAGLLRRRRQRP